MVLCVFFFFREQERKTTRGASPGESSSSRRPAEVQFSPVPSSRAEAVSASCPRRPQSLRRRSYFTQFAPDPSGGGGETQREGEVCFVLLSERRIPVSEVKIKERKIKKIKLRGKSVLVNSVMGGGQWRRVGGGVVR